MDVSIVNDIATVNLSIATPGNQFRKHRFEIDTGFQGSCIFIGTDILERDIRLSHLRQLPQEEWVTVADGRQVPTFAGVARLDFGTGEYESLEVQIIDAIKPGNPLIGMQFLRENEKHLSLDFKTETHLLN